VTPQQIKLFEINTTTDHLSDDEIVNVCKKSRNMSRNITGALQRLGKAKRYHDCTAKLSQEVVKLRIENDKLKDELNIMKKAN